MDTAIVDLSHSHTSREFIRDYDASPDAKATYYCNSLDEAKQLVQKQAVHGIIYIPSDFDTKLNRGGRRIYNGSKHRAFSGRTAERAVCGMATGRYHLSVGKNRNITCRTINA